MTTYTECGWDDRFEAHVGPMPRDELEAVCAALSYVLRTNYDRDPSSARSHSLKAMASAERRFSEALNPELLFERLRRERDATVAPTVAVPSPDPPEPRSQSEAGE